MTVGRLVAFIALFFVLHDARGQSTPSDTSFFQASDDHWALTYSKALGRQSPLYNGREYVSHDPRIKGHPFFEFDHWVQGSLVYDGATYHQLGFIYDIVREQLVIAHPDSGFRIHLVNEKIERFTTPGHSFIRIVTDSTKNPALRTGFYDLLYEGSRQVQVLAKRAKVIFEDVSSGVLRASFEPKDAYFLRKDGVYYPVGSKKAVLAVFDDQKKALQKSLREARIRFRRNREAAVVHLAKRYNELSL